MEIPNLFKGVYCMNNTQNLRRRLNRIGYSLFKRGRGDNYGYVIVNPQLNCVIAGGDSVYGLSLEEVKEWLSEE